MGSNDPSETISKLNYMKKYQVMMLNRVNPVTVSVNKPQVSITLNMLTSLYIASIFLFGTIYRGFSYVRQATVIGTNWTNLVIENWPCHLV